MLRFTPAAILSVCLAGGAQAAMIMPGSAGIGFTTGFTVNTAPALGVFSATNAFVTVANTTGGFSTPNFPGFPFSFGNFNGSFTFSKAAGGFVPETVPTLLTFGAISFTAASVTTISYSTTPGVSTSGALYLLGYSSEAGFTNTPTSLTLTFNSTSGSPFSASATLATPPAAIPSVPEPASWALMMVGFGAMGAFMRTRRDATVTFA